MRRDPWFDNAKMALVTLVVLGHAWVLLPDTAFVGHGYDFLYAWHVPAFVFVTGYLSRSFTYTRARMWQLVRTVAVPYVVFEAAIAAFRILVGGEELADLWRDPHWPMWYLAALFFWRLLTPVLRPMWGGLAVAVAVSIVAGLYAGDTLDVARVLGLLPFFVMGLKATPERLELLRTGWARVAAVVVFVGIWLVTARLDDWAATEWLYYRSRYDELDVSDAEAFLVRACLLAMGTLGALAFFALVPRVGGWFTRMGSATLVVYLFHGFFVKGAEYAGFTGWAEGSYATSVVVVSVGAVGLSLLLAWQPVSSRLQHLVDPVGFAERRVSHAHDLRDATVEADVLAEAVQEAADEAAARDADRDAARDAARDADHAAAGRR